MNMSAMLMLIMDNPDCQLPHHMMIAGVLMRCKKNVCSVSEKRGSVEERGDRKNGRGRNSNNYRYVEAGRERESNEEQ